jgi:hypothetical protein
MLPRRPVRPQPRTAARPQPRVAARRPTRAAPPPAKIEASAGFEIHIDDQGVIEDNARERFGADYGDPEARAEALRAGLVDDAGEITRTGWDLLNEDIRKIEGNALSWLRRKFQHARDDGHGSGGDLVGSVWFDPYNEEHAYLIELASQKGRSERIDMVDASYGDLANTAFNGVSGFGANVLGGAIYFFDVQPEEVWEIIEAASMPRYRPGPLPTRKRAPFTPEQRRTRGLPKLKASGRAPRASEAQGGGPRLARYRWVITKDYIGDGENVGVEGPRDADSKLRTNRAHFVIKDDDGETYYEGDIYGKYDGFEPLDDFGTPNDGATTIFYGGKQL